MTDATGNVVQMTSYDPFGAIRSNATYDPDPADGLTPFETDNQFNGKERDTTFHADDDIFDFGPRMYFADVGVWMSPDSTFNDGVNRYAFVNGDPINSRDPSGKGGVPLLVTALMGCTSPPSEKLTGRPTNEIVFVFVRHSTGFVYHAGAWIPNSGDPMLVDFGGSYGAEAWNDSTDVMFGRKADLEEYLTYERKDGDALDLALVGTSPTDRGDRGQDQLLVPRSIRPCQRHRSGGRSQTRRVRGGARQGDQRDRSVLDRRENQTPPLTAQPGPGQ